VRDDDGARTEVAELQGAVHHVDTQAGRLFDAVKDLGLEENTLVIFTADHGVALPRAKCSLYDPGLQVPFILRLPSREGWHGGITHDSMISNVDYLPTLLDLVGISVPQNVQGRSFAPLLDGGDYTPRDAVFGEITYHDYYDPRRCIRTDTHKLIVNFSAAPAFMDPTQSWRPRSITVEPANPALVYHPLVELYDLREDPWEQKNLSEDPAHAPVRDELLRRLHAHLSDTQDPLLEGAVTSPMHMRAVEALSLEHA
jgi:N-sulfoglucosamine sulfohydrolase